MSDSETIEPFPPRYRQLKRWTLRALVVLALLGGLRAWWGYEAQRRMDAFIAEAHARGEKILPHDFVAEPLPPGENAAELLQAAAAGITYTPQQQAWENNFNRTSLSAADVAVIQGLAWQNRQALAQVRQARAIAGVDWRVRPGWQAISRPMPLFNRQRQLATTLMYVAVYEHHVGNDAEAVELLLDLDRQRSAVGRTAPYLVAAMVSWGIDGLLSSVAFDLAPTMDIAPAKAAPATTRPAPRQRVRHLIDRLLDDSDARQIAAEAWEGETMLALDMSGGFGTSMQPAVLEPVLRPLSMLDGVRAARWRGKYRSAATQPTFPAAEAMVPSRGADGRKSHLHEVATALSDMSKMSPKVHEARFRVLSDRRAAAAMLAIRLYMLDHDGRLPPTLEALVPDYLPHVPADPMSPTEQPLRYIATAATPCLYSVGTNYSDNGGASVNPNRWHWNNLDAVYPIPRPAAATAPATRSGS